MAFVLHQLLSESALRFPNKESIVFGEHRMTYIELERASNRMAHLLLSLGVEKGNRVGIYMNRGIKAVIAAFGILKAGGSYVPIDPMCPTERLKYIMSRCGMKSVVSVREKLGNVREVFQNGGPVENIVAMDEVAQENELLGSTPIINWQNVAEEVGEKTPSVNVTDCDVAYILFTSGSTGSPKGVTITHRNSMTFIDSAVSFFGLGMEDRLSNVCPLHFDMSVFDIFAAIKAGASVVIIPETTAIFPARLAELVAKNAISVWNSVPSTLCLLANQTNLERFDFRSLRLVLFAGEVFPIKYLRRLQRSIPTARFCNMYGQTEANSSTYYWVERLPSDDATVLPIGRALPNFEVFAMKEDGQQVKKAGEKGEFYVRSSSVALGYWEDSEKTLKSFVKDPLRPDLGERVYKTGDLVQLDIHGDYSFIGRKDHMVKSRGYRIEIGEIEAVLSGHPGVRKVVVIPIPDKLIGNRISAFLVPSTAYKIEKREILEYCSKRLPKYMMPEILEFREDLPSTSSGKVDRQQVKAFLSQNP